MREARAGAVSSILPDGRVLVTGGYGTSGALTSAEYLGPVGALKALAPMGVPRGEHVGVTLTDGRVLVAGGRTTGDAATNAAEIYDPASDVWTPVSAMLAARIGATAVRLRDGSVLVAGGDSGAVPLATLERFNPATQHFEAVFSNLSSPRKNHAAVLLADGRVLFAGGSSGSGVLDTLDVYDPATGMVKPAGKMSTARQGLSATLLNDGHVLLAGGSDGSQELASTELFNPRAGSLTAGPPMAAARAGHMAFLIPGNNAVMIAGGTVAGQPLSLVEQYRSWSHKFVRGSGLSAARNLITGAAAGNGLVVVAGGKLAGGAITPIAETLASPWVATDKPDYQPGDTATITGGNWPPNTVVTMTISELPDDGDGLITLTSTTDSNGNFTNTGLKIDTLDLGVTFFLLAKDAAGDQAQITFTDGGPGVHFSTSPFLTNVSTCSPAIVIQAPSQNSAVIALSSSSGTGAFYSDAACTFAITSVTTSASNPPRATFYYKDSAVGAPTLTVTVVSSGRSANQTETITTAAINTTTSLTVVPSSVTAGVSTTVTLTATVTRKDTAGPVAGATIDFLVAGSSVGSATTNGSGVASVTFNPASPPGGSGLPSPMPPGGYPVVADFSGALISSITFAGSTGSGTLTVTGTAPSITSGTTTSFTVTTAGTFMVTATGTPVPALSDTGPLPSGVSFVDNGDGTATLAGTPALGSVGSYPLSIKATNGVSPDAMQSFTLVVAKANQSSVTVTGPTDVTYGTPGTATATGGNGTGTYLFNAGSSTGCSVSGTAVTVTDATGSCALTATRAGDANYNDSASSAPFTVNLRKANASITVTPYNVTYDGNPHTATGTATGVGGVDLSGSLTLSGTTHTAAGTYSTDPWSFSGGKNYNDANGTVSDSIGKSNAAISVTPYSVTYDGNAHTATGSATGVGGVPLSGLDLSGTTHTNAGTYSDTWSFTDSTGNYNNASSTVSDVIAKATATISVTPYSVTYDGNAHTATGTATGVKGESLSGLDLSATAHTNAGTYSDTWTFTDSTGNYNNASGTVSDVIAKATAAISVTPYSVTYDGNAHTATGTATGVQGESLSGLNLSGTTHTNAGTYNTDPWTFSNANYSSASGAVNDAIAKASATINVTPYSVTYDGNAHTATGGATGAKGESLSGLDVSATTHTNASDYPSDAWTFTDATGNYNNASGTVHDSIAKANAAITVTPYSVTYDGNAHTATGTAKGVKGESLGGLDLSGTTHTNAATYSDTWTFTDATGNYNNTSSTVSDVIGKANATISVTAYSVTYDGNPHTATGTATGVKAESLSGLDLSATAHVNAGTYSDTWTFTDSTGNYNNASGTVSDVIAKATATISVTPYSVTYDGNAHTATGTATGVKSESLTGLDLNGTTHTNAGNYTDTWSFTNLNYVSAMGTLSDVIAKASAAIVVTPYSVTYNGVAHTATGTATGAGGANLSASLNLSGTTHTNAGAYNGDAWSFSGGTNYNDASGTVNDAIAKANATIVVTPYSVSWDGLPHTATGTAKGVLNESLSGLNLSGTTHTNVGTYTDPWTFTDPTGNYNNANGTVADAIGKAPTSVGIVTITPLAQQYSDKVDLSAPVASVPPIGGSVSFYINFAGATQQLLGTLTGVPANSTATLSGVALLETVAGAMSPGNHTITAVFTPSDLADYTGSSNGASLTITQEDANLIYTGQYTFVTPGTNTSSVTAPLTFTVQDSNLLPASSPLYDPNPGDIRNARFKIMVDNNVACDNLQPALVTSDTRTGTIGCNYTFNLGNLTSNNFTITVMADPASYYVATGDTVIPVAVALPSQTDFITGGGYIVNSASAGAYAGGTGLKTNFGLNVKFNKQGTNLQGNVNIIVRGNDGHAYQIKSNSIQSLNYSTTSTGEAGAFISKANMQDLTSGTSIGGSYSLTINFHDNGQPGTNDTIGISVYNGGSLMFSSNWSGTTTVEQNLGGGNLLAH